MQWYTLERLSFSPFQLLTTTTKKLSHKISPYYYTILSNKYVVNDDDTHWTGWITKLLSTELDDTVRHKYFICLKRGRREYRVCESECKRDEWMKNWDLMGWAGTHEFIIKSFRKRPNAMPLHNNNYNELHFNEKVVHMVVCKQFCLSTVIGFSTISMGGEREIKREWVSRVHVSKGLSL